MFNIKKGNQFEYEFAKFLSKRGFWAHVVAKAPDGSQPFDVIAGKNGKIYTFDCKTVSGKTFPLSRVEENQEKSFMKLLHCGCDKNYFVFKRANGSVWLSDAWFCIGEKRAGVKSIEPGICDIDTWCSLCK